MIVRQVVGSLGGLVLLMLIVLLGLVS